MSSEQQDVLILQLASYMQPLCRKFLDMASAAGINCALIDTGRSYQQQEINFTKGVSWTMNSKHLPQPPEMKSEAFDVCPVTLMSEKYWAPNSPLWNQLGTIGEGLGLVWGGRFPHKDPGHFQYSVVQKRIVDA